MDGSSLGRRLKHTVCISCWHLQTSKVPSSLCIWHKKRLLTKAGAYRGGVVLIVDRCLAVAMTVPEGIGHHPTVGEPAMQWVDFLTFRGCQKKALTLANQGFSFGAGEMNRTPDLLITNELLYRLSYTGLALDYSVEW